MNVRLEPLRKEFIPDIAKNANNKKVWDNLRDYMPFPYTEKDAEGFVDQNMDRDVDIAFAILFNNQFAGVIGINPMTDVYRHSAEIGYWLGEPYWGKGIMSKALELMVDHCFNKLEIVRLHTGVFEYNKVSGRVLEKNGFVYEGAFKLGVQKNGQLVDELRYGMINPNYKASH